VPVGLSHPIPSAGPYYVAALIRGEEIVLRRNPHYRGPRPARLDTIVLSAGPTSQQGEAAVERGRADFVADIGAPPAPDFQPGGPLDHRYGRPGGRLRYAVPPSPQTVLLGFDSRRGLFADASLRRAVNLALDRRALAAALHGAPRSSLIPPGIPGYSPRQPYPAQDLHRARALARGHGGVARLVASPFMAQLLATLRPQLARIGVRVRARVLPQDAPVSAAPADLVLSAWAPDYPDPYDMINVLLDPAVSAQEIPKLFADPRWLARMRAAAAAPLGRRGATYARLDRALALGPAPLAVIGSRPGVPELVTARLGCLGYDLGRLDLAGLCLGGPVRKQGG
jgi:peptide/nickel transport system substrate-binding protein